jgi:hypothetical protein
MTGFQLSFVAGKGAVKHWCCDVIVQCPKCLTIETLTITDGRLDRCRRFAQRDRAIYHDCGGSPVRIVNRSDLPGWFTFL